MDIVKSEINMANEVELCVEVGSNIGDTLLENADINQLCRTCANTHDNMIPIFEGDGLEHDLQNKIDKHFPVNISKDDGLPNKMCFQCASTLVAWHDMFTGCIEAEKKLKHLLDKLKDDGQVGESVFGSSVVSEDSTSDNLKAQQKTGSEMEIDNEDGNDDDYAPEHGGDDDDDEDDDDEEEEEDEEDDDLETEVVLHKLDAKEKEKTVEVSEKGTTIRDQCVRKSCNSDEVKGCSVLKDQSSPQVGNLKLTILSYKMRDLCEADGGRGMKRSLHEGEDCKEGSDQTILSYKMRDLCETDGGSRRKRSLHESADCKDARRKTEKLFSCDYCGKVFRVKGNLVRHVRCHTGERPFECAQCGKQFVDRGGAVRHTREVHDKLKKFECDLCKRRFANRATLDDHRRTHTGQRPFVCDRCAAMFKTRAALLGHQRLHASPSHVCTVCGKAFKRQVALHVHARQHTGEKPHMCDRCGRAFNACSSLTRHLAVHSNDKPFKCERCGHSFKMNRYLRSHLKSAHCSPHTKT